VRSATLLVTNSYFTAESIYRAYSARACVSYLGVDIEQFRPLDLQREDYVFSVGAVSPLKGYDFQIDAIACMPGTRRPRLVIAGNTVSGAERSYLESRARQRGVSLAVHEHVTESELVRLYNRARALVYSPILEPFGFAPIEAMACGTPVVAVAEGGVRESVQHEQTGLLAPRDPYGFAEQLGRLLQDDALYRHVSETAVQKAQTFWNWSAAGARFLACIEAHLPGVAADEIRTEV